MCRLNGPDCAKENEFTYSELALIPPSHGNLCPRNHFEKIHSKPSPPRTTYFEWNIYYYYLHISLQTFSRTLTLRTLNKDSTEHLAMILQFRKQEHFLWGQSNHRKSTQNAFLLLSTICDIGNSFSEGIFLRNLRENLNSLYAIPISLPQFLC